MNNIGKGLIIGGILAGIYFYSHPSKKQQNKNPKEKEKEKSTQIQGTFNHIRCNIQLPGSVNENTINWIIKEDSNKIMLESKMPINVTLSNNCLQIISQPQYKYDWNDTYVNKWTLDYKENINNVEIIYIHDRMNMNFPIELVSKNTFDLQISGESKFQLSTMMKKIINKVSIVSKSHSSFDLVGLSINTLSLRMFNSKGSGFTVNEQINVEGNDMSSSIDGFHIKDCKMDYRDYRGSSNIKPI